MNIIDKNITKNRLLYFCIYTLLIIKSILNIILAFILKDLIDNINGITKIELVNRTLFVILFVLICIFIQILFSYLKYYAIKKILFNIKNDTLASILKLSIKELFKYNTSKYITLFTNHLDDIESNYIGGKIEFAEMIFNLLFSATALIYLNPFIGAVAIIATLISLMFPLALSNYGNKLKFEYSKKQEKLTGLTKDILDGFELLKSYGVENQIYEDYSCNNKEVESYKFKYNFTMGLVMGFSMFLGYVVFFSVIVAGLFLSIKNNISIGTLIACVNLANGLVNPIVNGLQQIFRIKSSKSIKEKFTTPKQSDKDGEIGISEFNESMELKDIEFFYPNTQNGISNINLTLECGKKYAIVGSSGSGKSTLIKLLLGHLDDYMGEYLIDKINIKLYKGKDLHQLISLVSQNTFLFDTSIEDNVRFYQDIDDNDIKEAIIRAGLETFINNRSNNKLTFVGENGNKVSGGEKQRISIARAFARKSDIIILDEATSNLDNKISASIEKDLIKSNTTIISATHKLIKDILLEYDQIIVMNNGRIVESGSFNHLMNLKGLFYSLYYVNNIGEV